MPCVSDFDACRLLWSVGYSKENIYKRERLTGRKSRKQLSSGECRCSTDSSNVTLITLRIKDCEYVLDGALRGGGYATFGALLALLPAVPRGIISEDSELCTEKLPTKSF